MDLYVDTMVFKYCVVNCRSNYVSQEKTSSLFPKRRTSSRDNDKNCK